ncbi:MAG TPA: putative sulfate/molybdate transporter [Terriglobia bacterium]|nr:putative sulfate/molybdate transporter [Terriglobia bacterium]
MKLPVATDTNSQAPSFAWPLTRLDVAGAFGDIGVLFPIAIALITLNHLNPTALFLTAGLTYCLAARYFQIPIAVQPFKAVAAIALALSLSPSAVASAGLLMGVLLLLVGVTNLAGWLAKLFTLPIVRGIQLGLGLVLAREGLRLVMGSRSGPPLSGGELTPWLIALAGAAVLLALRDSRRFPAALVLLALGIILGLALHRGNLPTLSFGPVAPQLLHPQLSELKRVLPLLVIPQFALTFGNSIVATENTARILYGEQAHRVTVRALCLSIGLVNLASAAIQGSPLCHGSGGITAHYRFGARTPKSSYVIGGICILLALFGAAAVGLLHLIPLAVLGVFLVYVGVQHAAYLRDLIQRWPQLLIAVCVGLVSFLTNLMWGSLLGLAIEGILWLYRRARQRQA